MEQFIEPAQAYLSPRNTAVLAAAAISIGTLYCFLGYRVLKFLIGLTGFLAAGGVGGLLALIAVHMGGSSTTFTPIDLVVLVGSVVLGGIAGALALLFLYRAGIFSLGFLGAVLTAHNAFTVYTGTEAAPSWTPWAVLGAGAAGGLIALLIERPVITLATSAIGAWIVVCGVAFFILGDRLHEWPRQSPQSDGPQWVLLASWGVIALAGALAQFATYRRKPKEILLPPAQ